MANFDRSFLKTNWTEGGTNWNPDDKGNVVVNGICMVPTYAGIAPAFFPAWKGFKYVKQTAAATGLMPKFDTSAFWIWKKKLDKALAASPVLQNLVKAFYRDNFWNPNRLSEVSSQPVADWIYDHLVNAGGRGAMWIQEAAGVKADGVIGPVSITAINSADPDHLLQEATDVAAFYRLDRAASHPSQIQFLPSWLQRDGVSQDEINQVMQAARDGLTYSEVADLKQMIQERA